MGFVSNAVIDNDTLLPVMPFEMFERMLDNFDNYKVAYSQAQHLLVTGDPQWIYNDPCIEDAGDEANLRAKSQYVEDDPSAGNRWDDEWHIDGNWFFQGHGARDAYNMAWDTGAGVGIDNHNWDTWVFMRYAPWNILNREFQFAVGATQRACVLLFQHKIAKCAQNCFCLDSRGRPST